MLQKIDSADGSGGRVHCEIEVRLCVCDRTKQMATSHPTRLVAPLRLSDTIHEDVEKHRRARATRAIAGVGSQLYVFILP